MMASKLEAAEQLADVIPEALFDHATVFSCTEAEALADFLRAWVDEDTARMFLASHSTGDEEGDQHEAITNGAGVVVDFLYREES